MEAVSEDGNFWWSIELEAKGAAQNGAAQNGLAAEEALLTVADLSGSVGSELSEENGAIVLRAVYLSSRGISQLLAELDGIIKDFPGFSEIRVRAYSKVENKPWHTAHMDAFPPLPVGIGLVVTAPWHKGSEPAGKLPIYIHPSSAFGTGYHESTQIALSFVERFVKAGDVVLDVGTGSGILFITGLKLGAARAAARDIDPTAVAEAKRNMELNEIPNPDKTCDLRVGDLLDGIDIQADLVTSNILLEPNLRLLDGVKNAMKPAGTAIFSGMTTAERTAFLPALSEAGLSLVAELTINDWWGCAAKWKD